MGVVKTSSSPFEVMVGTVDPRPVLTEMGSRTPGSRDLFISSL